MSTIACIDELSSDLPSHVENNYRSKTAEQTWQWIEPLLPKMGITRVANITGLDTLNIPVCIAIRPNSRGLSTSQGKGLELVQAKVSAAMESIESWHCERIKQPLVVGTYEQIRDEKQNVADVKEFVHRRAKRLISEQSLAFVPVASLNDEDQHWLPYETISTNFVFDQQRKPFFMQSSNGLAAGNTLTEALCQGIYEIIERDAVQQWFNNGGFSTQGQLVTEHSQADLSQLIQRCELLGTKFLIWDLKSYAGIPCFAVAMMDSPAQIELRNIGSFSGYGCHLDETTALQRALLEAIQSRLTLISGSRDDMLEAEFVNCRNIKFNQNLWQDALVAPAFELTEVSQKMISGQAQLDTLKQLVQEKVNRPIYYLNLTQKEIAIPVVKVVIPCMLNIGMGEEFCFENTEVIV